ncbi:MAG: hypothetical protein HY254_03215 [Burkholderiales bacterium]|nr:hypothetical protein [Burkholderiales bacterium]
MKILGIRTAPQQIRFAIVEFDGVDCQLLNKNSENALKKPAAITTNEAHIKWVKDELSRIFRQNPDVSKVALKVSEFAGSKNASSRLGDYLDAMVLLTAIEAEKPIVTKLYNQMATKRSEVKEHSENRVGRTNTNWDHQMADAVAVAWIARK